MGVAQGDFPHAAGGHLGGLGTIGAGDDPVVVGRETLHLLEALTAAAGTADEIGVARGGVVEGLDDVLGLDRQQMVGADLVIGKALRIAEHPGDFRGLVAGIGGGGGIAAVHAARQVLQIEGPGVAADARAEELAVPRGAQRQPKLEPDLLFDDPLHAAEGGLHRSRWPARTGGRLARPADARLGDGGAGDTHIGGGPGGEGGAIALARPGRRLGDADQGQRCEGAPHDRDTRENLGRSAHRDRRYLNRRGAKEIR